MRATIRARLFLRWTTALVVVVLARASAQTEGTQQASAAKPETGVLYAGWMMISLKPLAPFKAEIDEEQTLNDGTRLTHQKDVVVRDSKGRLYRELQIPTVGFAQTETEIRIDDSTQQAEYLCKPATKTCVKLEFQAITGVRRATMADAKRAHGVTFEDLGTRVISGVPAEGVRQTEVVAEGKIGNDRPLTITHEMWFSKELDVDMELKSSDPRTGLQTRTMTNVSLGEPDPKYFEPPVGYELVDMREQMRKAKEATMK